MNIIDINFNDMVGNSLNFKNNEELEKLVPLFIKKFKIKSYSYNIYDMEINIYTKKYNYNISEKRTDKFTIVKEDNFNNRNIQYMQVIA